MDSQALPTIMCKLSQNPSGHKDMAYGMLKKKYLGLASTHVF